MTGSSGSSASFHESLFEVTDLCVRAFVPWTFTLCSDVAQEQKRLILELREYAKEANIGKASMSIRRVEKVERDLLNKLPNQYTVSSNSLFRRHRLVA